MISRRVLVLALGLSLVFNVFVLVGFMQAQAREGGGGGWRLPFAGPGDVIDPPRPHSADRPDAPSPSGAAQLRRMAAELQLNDEQVQTLRSLQEKHRASGTLFEQSIALLRHSLHEELRREDPDLDRVRELVNEEAELIRQRRLAEANLYGRFVNDLRPEQRRALRERSFRGRGSARPPIPPRVLERFDVNRDGVLDRDELREARREMERRRRDAPNGESPSR